MKLRQKLAVVLASAMVVTAVPVVTMAASTTTVSKVVTVADDTKTLGELGKVPVLNIDLKNKVATGQQFYIVLENAEFKEGADFEVYSQGITIKRETATEATVTIDRDLDPNNDDISIALSNVIVKGEAKVTIIENETEISPAGPIVFATKSDSKATATVTDAKKFYTTSREGEVVGNIVITEGVSGKLGQEGQTITLEMEHDDFDFIIDGASIEGTRGFAGANGDSTNFTINDDGDVVVTLPKVENPKGAGVFTIKGLKVKSTDKNPSTGDLEVYVKGGDHVADVTLAVATVVDYGTDLSVDAKDEVKAGKNTKVKVTYKELAPDSIASGDVDFVLDNGSITDDSFAALVALAKPAGPIVAVEKIEKDGKITGFTLTLLPGAGATTFLDGFELEVVTSLGMEGEVTLSTSGRRVEDQEVVVASVTPNFEFTGDAMTLKVGQTKQVGGKLVITELEKGAIDRHGKITLSLPKDSGIRFTAAPTVTVNNEDAEVKTTFKATEGTTGASLVIELDKVSKEDVSTITIEGFEVTVDRTVPQGYYDLKVEGITGYAGSYTHADFFVVGTPNTEELAANGLPKGTASFVIGSKQYTVNGVTKTMDAAAYAEPGYTMVPVRYVAEALGVKEQDILFSAGTVTIFAGSRTIQLTVGSDTAMVNGAPIKMAQAVVAKDQRTYAPMGEIARILGVETKWDGPTQTASFENK